jgi:sporulation protein YlmC with PRC-barrel domain
MYTKAFAVSAGAALLASLSHAQYETKQKPARDDTQQKSGEWSSQSTSSTTSARIHRLGRFIGREVTTRNGEDLGEIDNFALNLHKGKVALVLLDVDDDIAQGLVPVPFESFEFDKATSENQPIALNIDKAQLRSAPTFNENQWSSLNDPQYIQRLHTHYHIRTSSTGDSHVDVDRDISTHRDRDEWVDSDDVDTNYPGTTGNPRGAAAGDPDEAGQDKHWSDDHDFSDRNNRPNQQHTDKHIKHHSIVSANQLIGSDIKNRQNDDVGEIEDVLVELNSGRIVYAVLSAGGMMGFGDTLRPVPVQAFQVQGSGKNQQLVLDMDANRLKQAPTLRGNEIPATSDPQLQKDIVAFYDVSSPEFVYGFADDEEQEDMRRDPNQSRRGNINSMINSWPQASQKAAQEMARKYGQPDVMSDSMLVWDDAGQFAKCIVFRNEVQHQFPVQHSDVLEQCVSYRVPADMVDDLAKFDGSLMVYRTGGFLSARCNNEAMNILALNLAHEIITGKRTPEDARQFLSTTAQQFMQGQSSEYTEGLMFQTSQGNAADPDRPMSSRSGGQSGRSMDDNRSN